VFWTMNQSSTIQTIIIILFLITAMIPYDHIHASTIEDHDIEFVIVSPTIFKEQLTRLVDHKQSLGISTTIVTIEDIIQGSYCENQCYDDAEHLKYFLKHTYENWETRYILLIGGKEHIPVRFSHINIDNGTMTRHLPHFFIQQNPLFSLMESYISDLYYADLYFENGTFCSWDTNNNKIFGEKNLTCAIDTVDLYPDLAIGRLLVQTTIELSVVIDKIIEYETQPNRSDWFQNLTVIGGDTHPMFSDILIKLFFHGAKQASLAYEGEYMGDEASRILSDFTTKKVYATGFFNDELLSLTKENIFNSINDGCGFLLLAGHGFPEAWGTHPPSLFGKLWLPQPIFRPSFFNISNVHELTNIDMLPIAVISACSCGDFNTTDYPFAWSFVQQDGGGAIGSFACTTLGTLLPTSLCTSTMNGKLSLAVFEAYDKGIIRLGDIWRYSIAAYLDDPEAMSIGDLPGLYWINNFNLEEWILFGDPTLKVGGYE